jgi:hypothetical protein
MSMIMQCAGHLSIQTSRSRTCATVWPNRQSACSTLCSLPSLYSLLHPKKYSTLRQKFLLASPIAASLRRPPTPLRLAAVPRTIPCRTPLHLACCVHSATRRRSPPVGTSSPAVDRRPELADATTVPHQEGLGCHARCATSQQGYVMLKAHVANVCFKCFRGMFHVFHMDVARVDPDVTYVAMVYTYVVSVCSKCFIHLFQTYVAKCFIWILLMFHTYVASVCSKCFSCFRRMLHQVLHV